MTAPEPLYARTPDASVQAEDLRWLGDMRRMVDDLFAYRPALYWLDFLLSTALAYGLAYVWMWGVGPLWAQIPAGIAAAVLIFRTGTFIHEIVHMDGRVMPGFRLAWNVGFGIPLLMPSLMYRNHTDHHAKHLYGTPLDGEYLPLAATPVWETLKYFVQAPALPLIAVARFLVLTPLSYLHPGLRRWTLERASFYGSNPHYRRRLPEGEARWQWSLVEGAVFVWLVLVLVLLVSGALAWEVLGRFYLMMCVTLTLNWARNMAAHRYVNAGTPMTYRAQLDDSINITGQTWLTVLMFPVGLRYHALHHLFPALPYHSLGPAHQRLMAGLPADHPYRRVNWPSFFAAARALLTSARASTDGAALMQRWRHVDRSAV